MIAQLMHRTAFDRGGNWVHARRATEADWRVANDAPALGVDLDDAPLSIAEIEVNDAIIAVRNAQVNLVFFAVVVRLRLDDAHRGRHGIAVGCAARFPRRRHA